MAQIIHSILAVGLASAEGTPGDPTEEEEDDVQVDMEDAAATEGPDTAVVDQDEDDDDEKPLKPSPDADTYFLFTKPTGSSLGLLDKLLNIIA